MSEDGAPSSKRGVRARLSELRWSLHNERFDVFARPVAPEDAVPPAVDGYELRFGGPDDLARAEPLHTELSEQDVRHGLQRLEAGHRVVVALADGLPVFTMWINPRNLNVPGDLKRRLADDEVFIYKAFTSPEHRGKRLYQAGMALVLSDLAQRAMRRLVGYAHVKKRASRAGLARLGFESVGGYRVLGYRDRRRVFVSRELDANFPERVARSGAGLE